jgi:hypothetical protein
MKGVALLFGVLLLLGGGAVAGAQFAPQSSLSFLDSIAGAKEFLASQMALYAGGGAAGLGLLLIIIGAVAGGSKKPARKPAAKPAAAKTAPRAEAPKASPQAKSAAQSKPAPQPAATQQRPAPSAKPQASAQPPKSAAAASDAQPTWVQDPRLHNRKRVSDLVTINDALKAYHAKHGKFPAAPKLGGYLERGKNWIPGLAPEFLAELPRDPAMSEDKAGPQYLYASNGADYKLVAQGVSLVGGTNVEVLGVKFDPSKENTMEKAAFGFWTEAFAQI